MILEDSGFSDEEPDEPIHIVGSIEGRGGHGKSHFALTAPGPIAFMDFDYNSGPVRKKFRANGKEIYYARYNIPIGVKGNVKTYGAAAIKVRDEFKADYFKALTEARTVVIDTATELWEIYRLAEFLPEHGRIEKIMPHLYTKVNNVFRDILKAAYDSPANVILVHKVKKEYKGDQWTGNWTRNGFGDIEFVCQVNLITYMDKYGEFGVEILKCTKNPSLTGEKISKPMNAFPFIASMVFEGTTPKGWE